MLTKKEANRLRGMLTNLLELARDEAFAGSQAPQDAHHTREEYRVHKERLLAEIRHLTVPE